jgi:hypothetical protein
MKYIPSHTRVLLLCGLMLFAAGCKKYLNDVAVNPNKPTSSSPDLMLSNIEVGTFDNFTGSNSRRCAVIMQNCTGALFYYLSINNYSILEADVQSDWDNLYPGTLTNTQILLNNFSANSPYYRGMARILKAMNLGLATDLWGDVPDKEAFQGMTNKTPAFDPQQMVLADIQNLLSQGIADLRFPASSNIFLPGKDDIIFNGQVKSWIAAAWVLKARYANRLSKRNPGSSATEVLNDLDSAYAAGFTSSAANMTTMFGTASTEINQWNAFQNAWGGYVKMGKTLVDMLKGLSDPRLPFYADSTGSVMQGAPMNNPSAPAANVGPYVTANAHLPIVSFAEAKFMEAECWLRAGNPASAALAHNDGVKASMIDVTGAPNPAYETANASETAATINLNKVMTQKYLALFTQCESWTDWRRTAIPNLLPNPIGVVSGIPRILPTSRDERLYNPHATNIANLLTHVWWDL